ncbi:MAG TPA: hypothetical protein VK927_05150 [Adhaeribacter sp.]|nr:hypothetical protein [Adhaeribacter sp.]
MRKSCFIFGLLLLFAGAGASAQDTGFHNELTYGINFNTNGGIIGGAAIRSSKTIGERWQQFWGLEVVEVKHPKESRYLAPDGVFVLGKTNYLFVFRPEYGREYTFFRKAPESGVEVNGVIGIGPSIGMLAPYYIDYDVNETSLVGGSSGAQGVQPDIRRVRYDPVTEHSKSQFIIRSAGFLAGIDESDFNFGAHLRTALSFEYGRYQESITGIETGFMLEVYPKKLIMLPEATNNQVFTSAYLTLYYGRRR